MPLEFDPATHTYTLDGRRLPSVTQIIGTVLPGQWKAGEWYLNRGRQLHLACALSDQGRLDRSSVDPEIKLRVDAWEKFRKQASEHTIEAIEKPLAHALYRFVGMLDRVFGMHGKSAVIDLKSSIAPQVIPQLGAYSLLWNHNNIETPVTFAAAVELKENGTYACKWLTPAELKAAERTFLALLGTYNFMAANGLLPKDKDE